jgi:hypothetical protein
MTEKSVPGIDKVKEMESSGDFDVEKVVQVIDDNRDIILKVEAEDYSISIYLDLSADKKRLVDGIADMCSKFHAYSLDLSCDVDIRIFKFWWDDSARNI